MKTSQRLIIASPAPVRVRQLILHNVIFDGRYEHIANQLTTRRISIDPLFRQETKIVPAHIQPRYIQHTESIILQEVVIHPMLPLVLEISSNADEENMFVFQDQLKHSALRFFMDAEMSQESGIACDAQIEIL